MLKSSLPSSEIPLSAAYDLALLDLDGVVYIGDHAVPGAPAHLDAARSAGMKLAFVTNNAARPPEVVGAHLRELGIDAPDSEVVTSAQAAARLLSEQLPTAARVYVVGGGGLVEALVERGLVPVFAIDDEPDAVVSGYHPDLPWLRIRDGAILVQRGLPWVASNTDSTVPTPYGLGPGNGAAVAVISSFTGRAPVVAGKPEPPLFRESVERVGGSRPLVVGDRLDTDVEGAHRAGLDSLLVMTGVTSLGELVAAPAGRRPTYVSVDLGGLSRAHAAAVDGRAEGWVAEVGSDDQLVVGGHGSPDAWLAASASAGWAWLDATGRSAKPAQVTIPGSV